MQIGLPVTGSAFIQLSVNYCPMTGATRTTKPELCRAPRIDDALLRLVLFFETARDNEFSRFFGLALCADDCPYNESADLRNLILPFGRPSSVNCSGSVLPIGAQTLLPRQFVPPQHLKRTPERGSVIPCRSPSLIVTERCFPPWPMSFCHRSQTAAFAKLRKRR